MDVVIARTNINYKLLVVNYENNEHAESKNDFIHKFAENPIDPQKTIFQLTINNLPS